jgi:hypothetical protein
MPKTKGVDLSRLTARTIKAIVDFEVLQLVAGKTCSICGGTLTGQREINEAVCSGQNPFTVAHKQCWGNRDDAQSG